MLFFQSLYLSSCSQCRCVLIASEPSSIAVVGYDWTSVHCIPRGPSCGLFKGVTQVGAAALDVNVGVCLQHFTVGHFHAFLVLGVFGRKSKKENVPWVIDLKCFQVKQSKNKTSVYKNYHINSHKKQHYELWGTNQWKHFDQLDVNTSRTWCALWPYGRESASNNLLQNFNSAPTCCTTRR